jgi:putative ABC transport system ATP-binding protein
MFLAANRLNKTYRTGEVSFQALKEVSIELGEGEIGVILGPSGSGKTTLMNMIGAIDRPDLGDILVGGQQITAFTDNELTEYRREHVGFVFQFYNLIPNLTVYENVELAANISKAPMKVEKFHTTIMIITHNEAIGNMAHRTYRMRSGEIVEARQLQDRLNPERIEW